MAYIVFKKDKQLGSMKQALDFVKTEVGQTLRQMIEKVAQDSSVIDKEELVNKICEVTEWKQDSEVFKFLGLSQWVKNIITMGGQADAALNRARQVSTVCAPTHWSAKSGPYKDQWRGRLSAGQVGVMSGMRAFSSETLGVVTQRADSTPSKP